MDTDKIPTNKFLKVAMDGDDTDTDNSALYYSAIGDSASQIYNDDSTLEADHEISLEKTMEKTVKHSKTPTLINSSAVKRVANSPLIFSGRKHQILKHQGTSSTPNMTPDRVRGTENDINVVNQNKFTKLTLDFNAIENEKVEHIEIINQKLEQVKLDMPLNLRFTSPSNPAYVDPNMEKTKKEPSPGQIQFQKTAVRVSMEYEDLSSVAPPNTGRPSMAIDDFNHMREMFKVKTPAKQLIPVESESEPDISPEEIRPPKTLEQVFEKLAAGKVNSSIDEMVLSEVPVAKGSLLPKRTSISTAYRKSGLTKAKSDPAPSQASQIPAVKKRATWASRQATIQLPGIPETKPVLAKKWSPSVDLATAGTSKTATRKSYLPTTITTTTNGAMKKRQSLHPAALKPTTVVKPEAEKKPKMASLKIATVNVGKRRSSFGKPVGKPNIRKSMLPSRPSPKPARRSVMPPPSTSNLLRNTGAIPKQSLMRSTSKSDLMCQYCDKKFAIPKALDDHLLLKCPKIPAKDKKKLLSQNYAARELEYSRKTPGNRSTTKPGHMDSSEASCSSVASGNSMPAPRSVTKVNRAAHSGVVHTPNKQISCMACGIKFVSALNYSIHMTSVHQIRNDSTEIDDPEIDKN